MLIMPSGDDPDHLPVKAVLDKKTFGEKCQYRRFDDMHHGFCAARYICIHEKIADRSTMYTTPPPLPPTIKKNSEDKSRCRIYDVPCTPKCTSHACIHVFG